MNRALWIRPFLVSAILQVATSLRAAPGTRFEIHAPPGWLDRSADDPDASLSSDERRVLAVLKASHENVFVAVLPGTSATISGYTRPPRQTEPINDAAMLRARDDLQRRGQLTVERMEIVLVEGLAWGRFEGTTDDTRRFVTFLIPGTPQSLWLTYAAPSPVFEKHLSEFDVAARTTGGAALPTNTSPDPVDPIFVGAGILLGALLLAQVYERLKRWRANRTD